MDPSTQTIFDRLDTDLAALLEQLKAYPEEQLNQQPAPGAWSALQVMQHLMLAEAGSAQYVRKKLSFNPELNKVSLAARWRLLVLNTYLRLPFKFKAPKVVSEEAFLDHAKYSDIAGSWTKNRAALRKYLSSLPDDIWDKEVYKHPFAGRLPLKGMLKFFDAHFQRHRKQIERTLAQVAG